MRLKTRLLLVLFVVVACSRSYEIYSSKYPVSFSCDISQSPFNKVQTWGYFLSVRSIPAKGEYEVKEPNGSSQTYPCNEVQNRIFQFGLAGLIIGKPYFGDDMIYAYDLGCPQCDRASSRLNIKDDCTAVCPKCGNSYDLNNGGVAKTGDSRPLYRYRTALNGNMLMIHN